MLVKSNKEPVKSNRDRIINSQSTVGADAHRGGSVRISSRESNRENSAPGRDESTHEDQPSIHGRQDGQRVLLAQKQKNSAPVHDESTHGDRQGKNGGTYGGGPSVHMHRSQMDDDKSSLEKRRKNGGTYGDRPSVLGDQGGDDNDMSSLEKRRDEVMVHTDSGTYADKASMRRVQGEESLSLRRKAEESVRRKAEDDEILSLRRKAEDDERILAEKRRNEALERKIKDVRYKVRLSCQCVCVCVCVCGLIAAHCIREYEKDTNK